MKLILVMFVMFIVGCGEGDLNNLTNLKPINDISISNQFVRIVCIEGHIYYSDYGPKLTDDGKPCDCK